MRRFSFGDFCARPLLVSLLALGLVACRHSPHASRRQPPAGVGPSAPGSALWVPNAGLGSSPGWIDIYRIRGGSPSLRERLAAPVGIDSPRQVTFSSSRAWIVNLSSPASVNGGLGSVLGLPLPGKPGAALHLTRHIDHPYAAALSPSGHLWVANFNSPAAINDGLGDVAEFVKRRGRWRWRRNLTRGVSDPGALAFDPSGNLWVLDFYAVAGQSDLGGATEFLDHSGHIRSDPARQITQGVSNPTDLAFDPSGNLWISNFYLETPGNTGDLVEYPSVAGRVAAKPSRTIQGIFDYPTGLAFDASGNLWVSNYFSHSPSRFGSVVELPPPYRQIAQSISGASVVRPVELAAGP